MLALGGRDEREGAVGQHDLDVEAFPHPDEDRVGRGRDDGVAVAVGDGDAVAAERDPEGRVGAGIDQPQPGALTGLAGQGLRRGRYAAVRQIVRVRDVAGPAQQRRNHGLGPAHAAAHAAVASCRTAQGSQDVVGGAAGAIDPVVERLRARDLGPFT